MADSDRPDRRDRPTRSDPLVTMRVPAASQLEDDLLRAMRNELTPVLLVMSGTSLGQRLRLMGRTVIGRSPDCELRLSDDTVSNYHAAVEPKGTGWCLTDLESTNGTRVNGRVVRECELLPNDEIRFGDVVVRLEMHDAVELMFDDRVLRTIDFDELTGLYERRKFDLELRLVLEASLDAGEPFSLLAMDLDGVKAINDAYGHGAGERVIAETGRLIGAALSDCGFGCRFGGDEFLATLFGLDGPGAFAFAERISQAVHAYPFEWSARVLHAGISIGVASFPEGGMSPEELIRSADAALYRAKRRGRGGASM